MPEFIERASEIDTMESAYIELSRSHEYADETRFTTEQLEEKAVFWLRELKNPLRNKRNLQEVKLVTELLVFEIAYRKGETKALEAHYALSSEEAA